jgi:hypothetical protein
MRGEKPLRPRQPQKKDGERGKAPAKIAIPVKTVELYVAAIVRPSTGLTQPPWCVPS